jgi:dihydrolipoamide dehydrogenase
VKGYGKLTGPAQNGVFTVELTNDGRTTQLKAKNVILATGSEARMLPGLEANDRVLTNIEILSLKEIPKSLVIVGAGAVGVEFASIYRSFDCEVTIIEMLPRLVPVEDEEVSKELARVFRKRSINFHTSAKVDKVEKTKAGVAVTITAEGKQQKVEAERILIAVGRKPRTENIGLEKTKIKPDREFIKTDSWMQTAEPGVYAVGDIVLGTPQLGQADQPRAHPWLYVLPSRNRQRRPHRNQGPRSRIQSENRQVSLHRELACLHRRPARRLYQNRLRR